MTLPSLPVSADERERLEACVRERIRRPGAIQPHGMVITADPVTWRVLQVSENSLDVIGIPTDEVLGSTVGDLLGDAALEQLAAVLAGTIGAANPVPLKLLGTALDAIVHLVDEVAVIDLEVTPPLSGFTSLPSVYEAVGRLALLSTREQLWAHAAEELHHLTGFDRVMIYHFHDDGHGQVVGERRSDDSMEAYLGLHYPASDIPHQARELYLTKLSRTIASTDELVYQLVPAENPVTGEPLDLSSSELRSVSPHHLQFMRNIGQASTLSFSLIVEGELVGMITCAHRTERRLPYALRQALEVFAGQVALLLGTMAQMTRMVRANELLGIRQSLVEKYTHHGDLVHALQSGSVTMLDLVPAAIGVIYDKGRLHVMGEVDQRAAVDQILTRLHGDLGALPIASESLTTDYPELADQDLTLAGMLVVPFGDTGDFLAWFRSEITETIDWLGDQTVSNRDSTLSPRNSFSAWSASVSGVAEPWGMLEDAALGLAYDLDRARDRLAEAELAKSALRDALTGLPNRRLVMDRLVQSVAASARGRGVAVLFIDIDSFKELNDTYGHETGDAVLSEVAQRFLSVTRSSDTVARLGGDEFVVVCHESSPEAARSVAERLHASLSTPLTMGGRELTVTASIGLAVSGSGDTATSVLRRADQLMYRAKRAGKNQTAHDDE